MIEIVRVAMLPDESTPFHSENLSTAECRYVAGEIEDFAAARNEALRQAAAIAEPNGWVLMLDADEHLGFSSLFAAENQLRLTRDDVLFVKSHDGTYGKEKLFRVPIKGNFVGPTHECFIRDPDASVGTLEGATFWEDPKTPEQLQHKLERDNRILERHVREHPNDPRWWYYWGDTLENMGNQNGAFDAFLRCWGLDGWDEESAWAAYRIARAASAADDHKDAIRWCLNGMQRHAGMAELYWLAGYSSYKLGRHHQAIRFSKAALLFGDGSEEADARINFRHPPALKEAPWQVLEHSYRALGMEGEAAAAARMQKDGLW